MLIYRGNPEYDKLSLCIVKIIAPSNHAAEACTNMEFRNTTVHDVLPQVDFRNITRRTTATNGLVAADNSRCSEIGREVLSHGGNAVDAAVAVALCLGVVNPVASGLGGGAFIMVRMANGTAEFVDAREIAPAAATADMFAGECWDFLLVLCKHHGVIVS